MISRAFPAFIQYLTFDGTPLPLPDSYEVQMADVEADSGGETEAEATQRVVEGEFYFAGILNSR